VGVGLRGRADEDGPEGAVALRDLLARTLATRRVPIWPPLAVVALIGLLHPTPKHRGVMNDADLVASTQAVQVLRTITRAEQSRRPTPGG